MYDDTVSNDASGVFIENSRWKQMEFVFGIADNNGVTSVGTASDTGADIIRLVYKKQQVKL